MGFASIPLCNVVGRFRDGRGEADLLTGPDEELQGEFPAGDASDDLVHNILSQDYAGGSELALQSGVPVAQVHNTQDCTAMPVDEAGSIVGSKGAEASSASSVRHGF